MAEQQPMYRAYTIIEREKDDAFWLNIGVGFVHKDTKGLNVILQALPLNGRLVLRVFEEEPEVNKVEHLSKVRRKSTQTTEQP